MSQRHHCARYNASSMTLGTSHGALAKERDEARIQVGELKKQGESTKRSLVTLKGRRSVRLMLGIAKMARPLFRTVRDLKRRVSGTPSSVATTADSDTHTPRRAAEPQQAPVPSARQETGPQEESCGRALCANGSGIRSSCEHRGRYPRWPEPLAATLRWSRSPHRLLGFRSNRCGQRVDRRDDRVPRPGLALSR